MVVENLELGEEKLVMNNRTSTLHMSWRTVQSIITSLGPQAEAWAGMALEVVRGGNN